MFKLTTGFRALSVTCLLAISSVSQAAITAFTDDFESYNPAPGNFFTPWTGFSDNCGFPGGYTFVPSTSGGINNAQFSALGNDGAGNNYINVFANYENAPCHTGAGPKPNEISVIYREFLFTAGEAAASDTWQFKFDYREADIPPCCNTNVAAYIRVLDGANNILDEVFLDTSGSATWQTGSLTLSLLPIYTTGGKFQVGFLSDVRNYEDSGVFYDNASLSKSVVTPIEIKGRGASGTGALHPHHDGTMLTSGTLPDDLIPVIVFGQSTGVGDPVNLNTSNIDVSTVQFGPGRGGQAPGKPVQTGDYDSDGQGDSRFRILMSDADFACTANAGTLAFELTTGEIFAGSDTFTSNCNAQCHTGQ